MSEFHFRELSALVPKSHHPRSETAETVARVATPNPVITEQSAVRVPPHAEAIAGGQNRIGPCPITIFGEPFSSEDFMALAQNSDEGGTTPHQLDFIIKLQHLTAIRQHLQLIGVSLARTVGQKP